MSIRKGGVEARTLLQAILLKLSFCIKQRINGNIRTANTKSPIDQGDSCQVIISLFHVFGLQRIPPNFQTGPNIFENFRLGKLGK